MFSFLSPYYFWPQKSLILKPFCIVRRFSQQFPVECETNCSWTWVVGKRNGIQLIRTEKEQKSLEMGMRMGMGMGHFFRAAGKAKRKTISINVINLPDNFTKGAEEVEKQRKWLFHKPTRRLSPDYRLLCCRLVIAFITAEKGRKRKLTKYNKNKKKIKEKKRMKIQTQAVAKCKMPWKWKTNMAISTKERDGQIKYCFHFLASTRWQ